MTAPRIGSVCTGYGGLDIAVQAVFGGELAWVADNDPGAALILAHHHPKVPNLGDITAVDWHDVEPVDIYIGGYPCQPFSTAGKRKGTKDARHLWPHIARALGVLRPRLAVFENVAGHLSLGFDTVLGDLARLGFDADWCCVRASDIGAAHQRNRLFLLAWPADTGSEGLARRWAERTTAHRRVPVADAIDLGKHGGGARGTGRDESAARGLPVASEPRYRTCGCGEWMHDAGGFCAGCGNCTDPELGRPDDAAAHPAGVGEREPADQAQSLAGSGQARQEPGRGGGGAAADADRNGREEQQRSEPGLGTRGDPDGRGPQRWGPYAAAIERWTQVIGRPAPRPTDDLGRLNPPFVEWLMALDDSHVTAVPGLSRTAQLKALGNGVVWPQAVAALRILLNRSEPPAWGRAAA
ncbi:DNA cytosine methyltransferase [Streptomyces sp. SID8375]|uniref:DNA cytosine methyltransferase n=1 Tax=unclassified Streptomyces TaxID=2593676 RepID=UPI000382893E|nr:MULTISPECIES: DNA cytosine methyltransferase [unclassified Streptomyces]MYX09814.1 DNA cytosine methyltransferase [Streptomyces sp. SID8375]